MTKWLLLLPSLIACHTMATAQTMRVLFIGNSYTYYNDLPAKFVGLATDAGQSVTTAQSTIPGYSLEEHWSNTATLDLIRQGDWDFVVIQEQSQKPAFPDAQVAQQVLPYAQRLADSVRTHSPCAEVVYYMTWGRENGDAMNCFNWPPVCTYEGMQERLRNAYLLMAEANDGWCAPVGMAWWKVRQDHPGIVLYDPDESHPALAGTYLAASTIYSTVFRRSCALSGYNGGLPAEVAGTLRSIASSAVLDSLGTWNIGVLDPVADFIVDQPDALEVTFTSLAPGELIHWWDLGDGSTASDPVVEHLYDASGVFNVVHAATDACGRTDTTAQQVDVVLSGIVNATDAGHFWTWTDGATIFIPPHGSGTLHILALDGRELWRSSSAHNAVEMHVPGFGPGALWMWIDASGGRIGGRVPIPMGEGR